MLGSILSGAGAIAGLLGGSKKQGASQQLTGFQAMPKEVQDALLKQYLPAVNDQFNAPYQAIPMQRATNPAGDPFASQALYDLQNFSDMQGGYFTPYSLQQPGANGGQAQPQTLSASYGGGQIPNTVAPGQGGGQQGGGGSSSLAQQWLSLLAGNNAIVGSGGSSTASNLASNLTAMIKSGQLSLDSLGSKLAERGYGKDTYNPIDPRLTQGGYSSWL
jgi:hypothetical protein